MVLVTAKPFVHPSMCAKEKLCGAHARFLAGTSLSEVENLINQYIILDRVLRTVRIGNRGRAYNSSRVLKLST